MASKLYVYDSSSDIDRNQEKVRFSKQEGLVTLGVGSRAELLRGLDGLVANGNTFTRVLFQTHGHSGGIWFGDDFITSYAFATPDFLGKYERLFPNRTKMYFDGCNVAAGDDGWNFLAESGRVLLRLGGGITMGYTSLGIAMPSFVPFISGHTVHLTGNLRAIQFGAGGVESSRFPDDDMSMFEMAKALQKLQLDSF
jgi:hypothetical protein